jgi:hypothetical protein
MIKSILPLITTLLALNLTAQLGESRNTIESRMGTPYKRDTLSQSIDITYLYVQDTIREAYILTFAGLSNHSRCILVTILRHPSTLLKTLLELDQDSTLKRVDRFTYLNQKLGTIIQINATTNYYTIQISSI